jgi:Flp pilus assembly protein TadB
MMTVLVVAVIVVAVIVVAVIVVTVIVVTVIVVTVVLLPNVRTVGRRHCLSFSELPLQESVQVNRCEAHSSIGCLS